MENNFQIASAAISDRGLSEKRPQNEDSYLELNQHGLFVVADGVGGAQAGDVASQMAVEILGEAFSNMNSSGDAEEVMKIGIEKANAAIFQMSHDLPQLSSMATTIVALHLSGNIATIGHVGDSRLYRLDENGNLFRETQDHSVVEEEVRAGRMTASQAASHPSRNVISRALGAEQYVEVDLKTIMFEPNASFLLCSDGITRHIDDYQLREILTANDEPTEACRLMKEICYQRGAEDNLTAVIIKIHPQPARGFSPVNRLDTIDLDEQTVASARIPTGSGAFATNDFPIAETPTKSLSPIVSSLNSSYADTTANLASDQITRSENDNIEVPLTPFAPEAITPKVLENSSAPNINSRAQETIFETDEKIYRVDGEKSVGVIGKILSALALLLIGSMIGAAAYHFVRPSAAPIQQAPPQITEMKAQNIPFSVFEENRRNVDRNPQQFITAYSGSPQDATDFFLLGRAYLLTAKYTEAKQSLTTAKNLLAQTDEVNGKTLANEIAMALAIINDPFALKAFEKDISAANVTPITGANANVSVNR